MFRTARVTRMIRLSFEAAGDLAQELVAAEIVIGHLSTASGCTIHRTVRPSDILLELDIVYAADCDVVSYEIALEIGDLLQRAMGRDAPGVIASVEWIDESDIVGPPQGLSLATVHPFPVDERRVRTKPRD